MNQISTAWSIAVMIVLALFMQACDPETPDNEEEEIDTVTLTFTNGPTVVWQLDDTVNPTITLDANTTYTVAITFTNEEEGEDVTEEILAEDDEHIVCYEPMDGADVAVTRTDSDGTYEVGLATTWETGAASTGSIDVLLRHQPGVKDGTCTPGDSDVEVTFELEIQ